MAQQHKEGEEDFTMKTSTQQQEITNSSINPSDLIRFLSDISQLNIINDAAGFEEPNDTREESVLQSRQRTDSNAQENERLLATRVRELFGLDETEPFEAEYSCWLMNDVLLQGYMYLTKHYLLFFAYNPRENPAANKTGFLNKQQRNPPHLWERRWCVLQDGVLSYYQDSQQLFQPVGAIDLRNLSHLEVNTSQKNVFKLIGLGKTYNFEAGSDVSFLEWKKAIELSMFQIRKGGKNITLTVPLAKISNISIAPSNALFVQALDYQDFAMEEYYFMFFRDVAKTEQHLKRLWSEAENEGLGESGAVVLAVSDELSQEPSKESPSDVNGRRTWLPFGLDSVPDTIGQMLVNVRQMVSSDDDPVSVRREFSLPSNEEILSNFAARLEGSTSLGKLYITNRRLCFEALYPLRGTRVIVRYSQIEKIEKLATFIKSSLRVQTHIQHQKEFVFDFTSRTERDSAYLRISTILEQSNEDNILGVSTLSSVASISDVQAQQTTNPLFPATKRTRSADVATFLFDQPHETHVIPKTTLTDVAAMTFTPLSGLQRPDNAPQHFTMITIGSRGDVQPLVALAKGLMAQGHTVRIATHAEFGDWIRSHGIQFHELAGNPAELLELMAQHSIFSTAFIKRGVETFLSWFNQLLMQSWEAAKGTNAVIASPYSFAGYHVAEALGVPFYYFCPFPFTPTKAFPQPLITSDMSMGGSFNYLTHLTMDTVLWQVLRPRINAWRVNVLKIPAISFKSDSLTPVINCFSQELIPPPPDWSDFVHICGFFFLDNPNPDWHPSPALLQFMNDPLKKVVYIGFGSIVVDDPESMTDTIVEAVRQANVKAILAKGWSGRSKNVDNAALPREYPDFIFPLNAVPHDWLFPKIAAVVHHGGAGTTAAGLRAGVPTIIKPFFGDQYFWAERIKELNVGVGLRDLTVESLSSALVTITTNQAMITKAKIIGRTISQENGVENAIECIYRDLDYANSLAQKQRAYHQSVSMPTESGDASDIQAMEAESSLPLESTTAKLTDFEELGRSVRALEEANRELRERVATLELGFDQMRKDQQKLLAQDSS